MKAEGEFLAIYNPYTRDLLVKYGSEIINHHFEGEEEWCKVNYNDSIDDPRYLHIQLDYDECFQLIFYPRVANNESIHEEISNAVNSDSFNESSKYIKLVHTDQEWNKELVSFLEANKMQDNAFKKILY